MYAERNRNNECLESFLLRLNAVAAARHSLLRSTAHRRPNGTSFPPVLCILFPRFGSCAERTVTTTISNADSCAKRRPRRWAFCCYSPLPMGDLPELRLLSCAYPSRKLFEVPPAIPGGVTAGGNRLRPFTDVSARSRRTTLCATGVLRKDIVTC